MTPARDPKQSFQLATCGKYMGGGIMEEELWRRNHGGIIGGGIMDVELWRTSRRHLGDIWEAFGKHFEFIWDAFGRHLEGWRLRRHLGGI